LPQQQIKPALALSLHSTDAELRQHLLPRAPRIDPEELVELGETYARQIDYPIQYQWTLLKGINDSQAEMDGILRLLKGKYAIMNLIPYNSLQDDEFQRPDGDRIVQIVRYLHSRGVLTKVRNSAGQDIDGGCGQLRARATELLDRRKSRV
jgi:23S rRNA (adenine2503-C2)-methyltransferase